jgi:hypothetical protein
LIDSLSIVDEAARILDRDEATLDHRSPRADSSY